VGVCENAMTHPHPIVLGFYVVWGAGVGRKIWWEENLIISTTGGKYLFF